MDGPSWLLERHRWAIDVVSPPGTGADPGLAGGSGESGGARGTGGRAAIGRRVAAAPRRAAAAPRRAAAAPRRAAAAAPSLAAASSRAAVPRSVMTTAVTVVAPGACESGVRRRRTRDSHTYATTFPRNVSRNCVRPHRPTKRAAGPGLTRRIRWPSPPPSAPPRGPRLDGPGLGPCRRTSRRAGCRAAGRRPASSTPGLAARRNFPGPPNR
jgi:hypothetical protein